MKTRIVLSIMALMLIIANGRRSYLKMTYDNPHGAHWYLANSIVQSCLYFGLCLFVLWKYFPNEKK
jgi:hypothetical protein